MKATSSARSPFPWFGGKQKLADDLIGLFPDHNVYVEVFGGGASVLLSKSPSKLDVYNDFERDLTCMSCGLLTAVFEAATGASTPEEHQYLDPAAFVCSACGGRE